MNKLLKGSIAGAAGIALLLGGAGTFALWNQTATVAGGTVTSGVLKVAASGTAAWADISADKVVAPATSNPISNISTFKIVPGDTIQLTQTVTVDATGNNLTGTLTYDANTITTTDAAGAALKSALTYVLDADGAANVSRVGATNTFTVTPAAGQSTVTLKLKLTLPAATDLQVAQAGSVNLTAVAFKLAQTR